jgi:enoyl-CoA hydratase
MAEIEQEAPAEGVALLRINRPAARNALSVATRVDMARCIDACDADPAVRAIVITGNAKAFSSGGDLAELRNRTANDAGTAESGALWASLRRCGKPLIAAVAGYALGGGAELALHCDIVIAGEGAQFALTEVKVGIVPGAGGTQRMVRAAGRYKAARYLLTGDFIPAAVASDMGLVSEIVPDADVVDHAVRLAARIAQLPPLSVAAIRELIVLGPDASLDAALAFERRTLQVLMTSADRAEGIAAFLEKRQPRFTGR